MIIILSTTTTTKKGKSSLNAGKWEFLISQRFTVTGCWQKGYQLVIIFSWTNLTVSFFINLIFEWDPTLSVALSVLGVYAWDPSILTACDILSLGLKLVQVAGTVAQSDSFSAAMKTSCQISMLSADISTGCSSISLSNGIKSSNLE